MQCVLLANGNSALYKLNLRPITWHFLVMLILGICKLNHIRVVNQRSRSFLTATSHVFITFCVSVLTIESYLLLLTTVIKPRISAFSTKCTHLHLMQLK